MNMTEHNDEDIYVTICCICQKATEYGQNELWLDKNITPKLYDYLTRNKLHSHSYCPDCYIEQMKEIDRLRGKV